jgi:DNA-binding transcriptional LysR family regulator
MADSNLLTVFRTVVDEGSFTRAAEKLFRTQPAISQAIQRLEEELGERLLDRSGRTLALTDVGQVVYDCSRRQENLHREMGNKLAELRNKAVGRLVIGANESMTLYLLPHLSSFRRRFPKVRVVVQRSRSTGIPDALLAGDDDFGVVSWEIDDARFASRTFDEDHLSFVVPPTHRLAGRKKVSIQDLGMETFVAHNVPSPYRDQVIRAFHDKGVPLNMDVEMPTVESVRRMVQMGEGVAFLPRMCVEQDVRAGVLVEVPVEELKVHRRIQLVWVDKRPLSHAAKAFLEVVGERG